MSAETKRHRAPRSPSRRAVYGLLVGVALVACSDDEHKGTVSHGPTAAPTGTAAPTPRVRLVYSPKSPIATMRVAEIAKKRLAETGARVAIGGVTVDVEAPEDRRDAVKEAMSGGRLDLWLAAEDDLPADAGSDELPVKTETLKTAAGPTTRRFLEAPADQRDVLTQQAERHAGRAKVLLGPSGARSGPLRTFLVEPSKHVRGEYVASARALQHAEGARLVVTFDGAGRNFVRWESKQKNGFVLQVDGAVVGVTYASDEQKDGSLTFTLAGWSLEEVAALAKSLDGVALSHLTVLESEKRL